MLRRSLWVLALTLVGCSSALNPGGVVPALPAPTATSLAAPAPAVLAPETVVDEYKVGDPIECPFDPSQRHDFLVTDALIKGVNARCDEVLQVATVAVIKKHSLVSSVIGNYHVYRPYLPPGQEFGAASYIIVFDLADGSQVAGGVLCAVGPCQYMPPTPLDAPPPVDHSAPELESSPSS